MLTAGTLAGGGRRTADPSGWQAGGHPGGRRTPRRALLIRYRGAYSTYIHACATVWAMGEGGHGGSPIGEAGKMHQQGGGHFCVSGAGTAFILYQYQRRSYHTSYCTKLRH
jgi:hypothetical protein